MKSQAIAWLFCFVTKNSSQYQYIAKKMSYRQRLIYVIYLFFSVAFLHAALKDDINKKLSLPNTHKKARR